MPGDILVLVEHSAGKIDSLSFQLLAIGQRLAAEMKVDLLAAAIGHRMENVVEALQGHGTDKIFVVDDPALQERSRHVRRKLGPPAQLPGSGGLRTESQRIHDPARSGITAGPGIENHHDGDTPARALRADRLHGPRSPE